MFTGACKIMGNGLAAGCQLCYRKIYGFFFAVYMSTHLVPLNFKSTVVLKVYIVILADSKSIVSCLVCLALSYKMIANVQYISLHRIPALNYKRAITISL